MTGPTKIRHVGTKYTLSHNREYLSTGIEYLHSATLSMNRPRPIMLKNLPIMLLSTAQKYSPLCSKLCSSFLIMLHYKYST